MVSASLTILKYADKMCSLPASRDTSFGTFFVTEGKNKKSDIQQ
jgi:hypothetical protein